ncbi:site-2 protease family protein [Clostridium frigoris]|uniref:Site-2 protease family protein n=1 Tax=Clostridium frigoris TaxID=205327 RepID=A0ABS6BVD8_9CLOT|nr:site-2 protease family protein [Clostridium frigoris]MBU3160892.1 site-2 protease family protein [Clostridium frigoris]
MNMNYKCEIAKNRKSKSIINIFAIVILLSFTIWGGKELLDIMIQYQNPKNLIFSEIVFKIIIVYYFSIYAHEAGHLIVLKLCKYSFKLFIVGPFMIINDNNKLKVKFKISRLVTGGAIIIDVNNSITCEKDFKKFALNLKLILSGGVLFNIVLILLGVALLFFKLTIDIGVILLILNIDFIISCLLSNGDINRVIKLNQNHEDSVIFFMEDLVTNYEFNDFCKKKIDKYIEEILTSKKYNLELLSCLIPIIEHNLVHNEKQLVQVNKFINWFVDNYEQVKSIKNITIRIKADKLMYKIILYKMVSKDRIGQIRITNNIKKLNKHPLDNIYKEFEGYTKKQLSLENISR